MHERDLEIGRNYLLKHTSQTVRATVENIRYRLNINSLEKESSTRLGLNEIGAVVLECQKPVFCDPYRRNRVTGSFILVDPITNATVAAGMITGREPISVSQTASCRDRITRADQETRSGHRAVTICLETSPEVVYHLEHLLFDVACRVHAISVTEADPYVGEAARILNEAGVIALIHGVTEVEARERIRQQTGPENFFCFGPSTADEKPEQAAARIHRLIEEQGLISRLHCD
jgi:bifunctional enzyme CysN/CysC/sulfate adenylyltransferase subunit 1